MRNVTKTYPRGKKKCKVLFLIVTTDPRQRLLSCVSLSLTICFVCFIKNYGKNCLSMLLQKPYPISNQAWQVFDFKRWNKWGTGMSTQFWTFGFSKVYRNNGLVGWTRLVQLNCFFEDNVEKLLLVRCEKVLGACCSCWKLLQFYLCATLSHLIIWLQLQVIDVSFPFWWWDLAELTTALRWRKGFSTKEDVLL